MTERIELLRQRLQAFAIERDWDQFHTPKNLAMALIAEAGELVEIFQWLSPAQSLAITQDPMERERIAAELGDLLIYLVRLADRLEIDLLDAAEAKIGVNERKYPVDLSKGNAIKYDRRRP